MAGHCSIICSRNIHRDFSVVHEKQIIGVLNDCLAFKQLDNYTPLLTPSHTEIMCVWKQFHSYHYQCWPFPLTSQKRNRRITATNYLNWIKNCCLFALSLAPSTSSTLDRRIFYCCVAQHKRRMRRTNLQRNRRRERRKKKIEQTPCSMLMTIHVKFVRNRGKDWNEPFTRNEFLNKRRTRPGGKQLLCFALSACFASA